MLRKNPANQPQIDLKKLRPKPTHTQIIALGFLLVLLIGTLLLMLPVSTRTGRSPQFSEALFTATSATCVTGLVVQDTATYWSAFGQAVILLLIQIGGLGFMTIATMFFLLLKRRIGLRAKEVMSESINATNVGGVLALTRTILLGTLVLEGTGALLLSIRFIPEFGVGRGIWYSVFHAVSAFCNAGFDLMGVKGAYCSLTSYTGDALVTLTVMGLITVGGFGFLVWDDILRHGVHFRRYKLHSKIVLVASAVLTIGGALLFYALEHRTALPTGERILAALFDAVTPRTAGFNTTDTAALSPGGKLLTMLLMFIGGSPGSTAGGIKTTTIAVLLLCTFKTGFLHRRDTEAFGRRIEPEAREKAAQVFFTNLTLAVLGALVIFAVQRLDFSDVLFEVFSAIGTVGMTTGITRELTILPRCVLILLMYCGRVGSVSFALALLERRAPAKVTHPAEKITIG